jgi:two-component system, OmpR family, osmolarity sensor histidine kinase EnvZ
MIFNKRSRIRFSISLSKWTPRGLFARSLLIIVLPIAIMQILVTYLFFDLHWGQVSRYLSEAAAGDVAYITKSYIDNPSPENLQKLKQEANNKLRISLDLQADTDLPIELRRSKIPAYDRTLRRALDTSLQNKFWFDTTRYPDYVDIRVKIPQGVLRFLAYRDRVFASTGGIFILWLVGATLMLAAVSVLFIRNQVRPIERLSEAADSFGKGENVDLKPAGSKEIRRATKAFLDMRNRINRHIEQRTNILAGVSHDLRTPLTRLKLELAMMPKTQDLENAKADIRQMEEMLDEYLDFARGIWSEETETINLKNVTNEVANSILRNYNNLELVQIDDDVFIKGREVAIVRALNNLVINALNYADNIKITLLKNQNYALVHVDDDGPGIAPEKYHEALNPFSRLDSSRNQNKKGVGLGLSIARDIAHSHGGELDLAQSPMGGLRTTLRIPLFVS